jgi:aspartate-semialdehyde dehydrogenase
MKKIKVAVMGCTGLVGQQFVRLLDGHPDFELAAITASGRSAGRPYAEVMAWTASGELPEAAGRLVVRETNLDAVLAAEPRIVFSALPAGLAGPLESGLRERGVRVFTNASAHRMDADVPVVIPEINPGHLDLARRQLAGGGGFIVANSNCSTSCLVLALKPLERFGIREVVVTTFQSISGAGRRGLAAMDIAGNVIPFIRQEEEKMARESKRILGGIDGQGPVPAAFEVRATCCRVPVREGHLMSALVRFEEEVSEAAATEALSTFRGVPQELGLPTAPKRPVIVREEEDRPQPALDVWAGSPDRARGMAVSVGRIRSSSRAVSLVLLVHNTVRGAAGTCVLAAELAVREKLAA